MKKLALAAAIFIFSPGALFSADDRPGRQDFVKAVEMYREGRFEEAGNIFESLTAIYPASPELLYNLGCVNFKLARPGRALLHLERARRAAPRDSDIADNIRFVSLSVNDPDWEPTLVSRLGYRTLDAVFAAALLLLSVVIALKLRRPEKRFFWPFIAAGLVFSLALTGFIAGRHESAAVTGVCVEPDTGVRSGPSPEFPVNFTVGEGKKVRILAESGDWLEIGVKSRGVRGWVEKRFIEKV